MGGVDCCPFVSTRELLRVVLSTGWVCGASSSSGVDMARMERCAPKKSVGDWFRNLSLLLLAQGHVNKSNMATT